MKNITDIELITKAQAGNYNAIMELWGKYAKTVKNTHENGRTGTKCSRAKRSKYAQTFEEASGELYFVFLNAINTYDPTRGASFNTYLTYKCKMAALDHLRNSTPKITIDGEAVDITFTSLDMPTNSDGRTYTADEMDEKLYSMYGNDQVSISPFQYAMERKTKKILAAFDEGSVKYKTLKAWLDYARANNENPTMEDVANMIGYTKANVSRTMKEIRKDLAQKGITL